MTVWTARAWVWAAGISMLAAACGEDGEGGDNDTLLTGLSGLIILIIAVWLIVRALNKRG